MEKLGSSDVSAIFEAVDERKEKAPAQKFKSEKETFTAASSSTTRKVPCTLARFHCQVEEVEGAKGFSDT